MISKLNTLANLIEELDLSVKKDSSFYASIVPFIEKKSQDCLEIDEISEDKIDEIINFLNEIKRKNFQMKILDVGKKANTQIELNEAKNQGLESLIEIPDDVKNNIGVCVLVTNNEVTVSSSLIFIPALPLPPLL